MEPFSRKEYERKTSLIAHTGTEKPPYEEYLELVQYYGNGGRHAEARAIMEKAEAEAAAAEEKEAAE